MAKWFSIQYETFHTVIQHVLNVLVDTLYKTWKYEGIAGLYKVKLQVHGNTFELYNYQ